MVAPAKTNWMATSVTVLLALLVMYVRQVGLPSMYRDGGAWTSATHIYLPSTILQIQIMG